MSWNVCLRKEGTVIPRADFDIFSQGVRGLARGVGNFSPLTLLTRRRCAAPRLRQAIAYCRTFLKFIFLDLFRYIFCKGTNKTTMAV